MATIVSDLGTACDGEVASFDDHVGLGEVVSDQGERHPFHCTQIADGSRTIAAGTAVRYVIRAGGPGRWEAFDVRPR